MKTVDHWGQRKLLLSEIEFLTLHADPRTPTLVVYAGAAPGAHIPYLSELFPGIKFVLVDPASFCDGIECPHIQIRQRCFTHATAVELSQWCQENHTVLLFISDIRASDETSSEQISNQNEGQINVDMQWQMDWVNIMRPHASMMKFRLPYGLGSTEYLSGKIFFQVSTHIFSPPLSLSHA